MRSFGGGEQVQRTGEVREHAAAIDVCDEEHRNGRRASGLGGLDEAHVRDVALAKVDLRRAARALDDHAFEFVGEPPPRREDRGERRGLVVVVTLRTELEERVAVDDHLRALVARGLQQHRVEVDPRGDASGERLERLGSTDLTAVDGDGGVERHVLGLERRDRHAAATEDAAKRGHQRGLAGVRRAALHHQRAHRDPVAQERSSR